MIKITFLLFFTGHLLGDFYFQSKRLAQKKDESYLSLLEHSAIYFGAMVLAVLPIFRAPVFKWAALAALLHLAVDSLKYLVKKMLTGSGRLEMILYLLDQSIHILILVLLVLFLSLSSESVSYAGWVLKTQSGLGVNADKVLPWLWILLFVGQPASITIKKVLYRYKPGSGEENGHPNAGALVGILERCIILLLLYAGQYAAIGFVLTAKSIARYNKLAEQEFAEYYLLGTLLSTLLVIAPYLILF